MSNIRKTIIHSIVNLVTTRRKFSFDLVTRCSKSFLFRHEHRFVTSRLATISTMTRSGLGDRVSPRYSRRDLVCRISYHLVLHRNSYRFLCSGLLRSYKYDNQVFTIKSDFHS